jgi:hemolysin activation/secretion protein
VSVTAKPVSVGYRYSAGAAREGISAGVALQQNLPGGPRNDDETYGASRAGARARWRSWQLDAAWQRELASGWSPAARIAGQYSSEPLIAAEQFGLGGIRAVRGFNEREGAGDRGWRASLELYGPRFAEGQRLLGFLDAGRSIRLNAQPGEQTGEGVASFGIGWRAQFSSDLQIAVDAARVTDGTPAHPRGARSLHFAAALRF